MPATRALDVEAHTASPAEIVALGIQRPTFRALDLSASKVHGLIVTRFFLGHRSHSFICLLDNIG